MTEKQKAYSDEYLIDLDQTRAYMAAYPNIKNKNTAAAAASRLMNNPEVKAYINDRLKQLESERVADIQEVLEYLTSVLRGESESEVVVVENIGDYVSEARNVKKKPEEKERLRAAELLGKRYGAFTEKVDINGQVFIQFEGEDELED